MPGFSLTLPGLARSLVFIYMIIYIYRKSLHFSPISLAFQMKQKYKVFFFKGRNCSVKQPPDEHLYDFKPNCFKSMNMRKNFVLTVIRTLRHVYVKFLEYRGHLGWPACVPCAPGLGDCRLTRERVKGTYGREDP